MVIDRDFATRWKGRTDRWTIVKDFIAEWRRPLGARDGLGGNNISNLERAAEVHLPQSLKEWYSLAGARDDLVRSNNYLLEQPALDQRGEFLVFFSESDGAVTWGIPVDDLQRPDPPVWLIDGDCDKQNDTLSEFILQMLIVETTFGADRDLRLPPDSERPADFRYLRSEDVIWLERNCYGLGLPDWHWPAQPTRSLGGDGILITAVLSEKHKEAHVAALNKDSLDRINDVFEFESF